MLPWSDMLRAALAAGITPPDFWALSLREWRWLSGGGANALTRAELERLERQVGDPHGPTGPGAGAAAPAANSAELETNQ